MSDVANNASQSRQPGSRPPARRAAERRLSRGALITVFGATLFLGLLYVGYRWARQDALATLLEFSGQTERDISGGNEEWQAAGIGDDFESGDGARTTAASTAGFRLLNGAKLHLKPASRIRFLRRGQEGAVGLQVDVGEADVESNTGKVTIDSEFGPIALDPNSSVKLRRSDARLVVAVELGRIELGANKKAASAGETLSLDIGGIVVDVPAAKAEAKPAQAPAAASAEAASEPATELKVGDGVASAELVVTAGTSFVVHDPSPPTTVGFQVAALCQGPARLTAGTQATEANDQVSLRFARGLHRYEIRCLAKPEVVAARGELRILQDAGTGQLPTFAPTANVTTDGRRYTVMYQHRLPAITVSWPSAPSANAYSLNVDGKVIKTKSATHTFASGALTRGSHSIVFAAATEPARQSRTTTIEVVYDVQAPAARVSDLSKSTSAGEALQISGQALPGWNVSVAGKAVALDPQQRFTTDVSSGTAVPIAFSHPVHGTHYYLRRAQDPRP